MRQWLMLLSVVCLVANGLFVGALFAAETSTALSKTEPSSSQKSAPTSRTSRKTNDSDFGHAEVELINEAIRLGWSDHRLVPSKAASEGTWCRRVYLDLIGRVPTVEELEAFLGGRKRGKRARLVDRLLGEEYKDEYTRNWTTLWTNVLIGRTGGTEDRSLIHRSGMEAYLRASFAENKPYDRLVHELVTASGSCRPGDDDFNGAANFLADKLKEQGIQATSKTAQIFLGMAVGCTQCHNHPFNEQKQNQFWELNAFFRQTRVERLEDYEEEDRYTGRVVDWDFAGEGRDPSKADLYFEQRNGKLKVAYPVFIDGTSLAELYAEQGEDFGDSGYLEDIHRRQELSKMLLASRDLDRAIVNRMWAHFFGYGFTKPIDDIGPHNRPTHPELLDKLGQATRDADFDLQQLMRWIVLSEPYSLSSRTTRRNASDDPALGVRPMFSHFYLRSMQAEQLYESLLVVTDAAGTLEKEWRASTKQQWLKQFNTAFGTDENDESTTFNGSIPQVLMMMNGPLTKKATGNQPGSMLAQIATDSSLSNGNKIRYLYQAALSRWPSRKELMISNQLLAARKGNVGAALQDIWWALLNSNEFILIR